MNQVCLQNYCFFGFDPNQEDRITSRVHSVWAKKEFKHFILIIIARATHSCTQQSAKQQRGAQLPLIINMYVYKIHHL